MIPSATISAYNGLQQNLSRFAQSAERISNPATGVNAADISEMKLAESAIKINSAVLAKANEMSKALVDIIA